MRLTRDVAATLPDGTPLRFAPRPHTCAAAQPGARATVDHWKSPYLRVRWVRDGLDYGQQDGSYYPEDFELDGPIDPTTLPHADAIARLFLNPGGTP